MRASTSWLAWALILEPAVVGRVLDELEANTSGNKPRMKELEPLRRVTQLTIERNNWNKQGSD